MRKLEQKQWDYLDRTMKGRWDVQRHEDKHSTSIPDVSFAARGQEGWLELKAIPKWPANEHKTVTIAHLEAGQVNWAEERGRRGTGRVWMLLVVGEEMGSAEWFLVHWENLRKVYDRKWTQDDFRAECPKEFGGYLGARLLDHLEGR